MSVDPWEIMVRTIAEGPTLKDVAELCTEVDALRARLPGGMKHCTIEYVECATGHGRLTATNWIDNGCPQCALDELRNFIRSEGASGKFITWQATGGHVPTNADIDRLIEMHRARLREKGMATSDDTEEEG